VSGLAGIFIAVARIQAEQMPLYEYKCQSCGKTFEVIQKFSDAPLTTHAECGGGPVEKLFSAPSFQFKGTGWYVTDYGKGNKGPAKPESTTETKKESKSETKSETTSSTPPATNPKPAA
jgi:putative FmdB family regulatory protein